MTPEAKKARASEMLAALRGDRFKLFDEKDLVALGASYELRRSTLKKMREERAKRPFDERLLPTMTPAARSYLYHVQLAQRESKYHNNWRAERVNEVRALIERHNSLGPLDRPLNSAEWRKVELWFWHRERIEDYRKSCQKLWDGLTDEERLWFDHKPPVSRWAFDFPLDAPAPYRFYPTEETPERLRQFEILEAVLAEAEQELRQRAP